MANTTTETARSERVIWWGVWRRFLDGSGEWVRSSGTPGEAPEPYWSTEKGNAVALMRAAMSANRADVSFELRPRLSSVAEAIRLLETGTPTRDYYDAAVSTLRDNITVTNGVIIGFDNKEWKALVLRALKPLADAADAKDFGGDAGFISALSKISPDDAILARGIIRALTK